MIKILNFQKNTPFGKKDTEKILLIESRLGVLSAINYTFPFTGQSRPIVPRYETTNQEEVFELTDEDLLPKSREIEQVEGTGQKTILSIFAKNSFRPLKKR